MTPRRFTVLVCRGPECGDRRGSAAIHRAFHACILERNLAGRVALQSQSCFGRCTQGPNVMVREETAGGGPQRFLFAAPTAARGGLTALYNHVSPADPAEILDEHVLGGKLVRRLIELRPPTPALPPPGDPTKGES